jgi:hypothetical protein
MSLYFLLLDSGHGIKLVPAAPLYHFICYFSRDCRGYPGALVVSRAGA